MTDQQKPFEVRRASYDGNAYADFGQYDTRQEAEARLKRLREISSNASDRFYIHVTRRPAVDTMNRPKYEDVKSRTFAKGTVPNGYFGDTADVEFYFDIPSGKTLTVADCGYYDSGLPPANCASEAMWLLENHPSSRATNVRPITAD